MELEKPITTQEELDSVLKDRLKRERDKVAAKYSDYDDLKKAAEERDVALEKAAKLEKEAADRKAADELKEIVAKVSKKTGVPEGLLRGADEAEVTAHAEAIAAAYKKKPAPVVEEAGRFSGDASGGDDMREFANKIFGR